MDALLDIGGERLLKLYYTAFMACFLINSVGW